MVCRQKRKRTSVRLTELSEDEVTIYDLTIVVKPCEPRIISFYNLIELTFSPDSRHFAVAVASLVPFEGNYYSDIEIWEMTDLAGITRTKRLGFSAVIITMRFSYDLSNLAIGTGMFYSSGKARIDLIIIASLASER